MPRRAGKAASRKARQRNAPRSRARPTPPTAVTAVPPVGTPDAREAVSLDPPRRPAATVTSGGSGLTARERAEYHYVERDLRNIAVLTLVMAILLLGAWVAFTALGIVR